MSKERRPSIQQLPLDLKMSFWVLEKIAARYCIPTEPSKVLGKENIPQGPHVIASNHRGVLEGLVLLKTWPEWIHFMGKVEAFDYPVIGYLFKRAKFFPIKRGFVDRQPLGLAAKFLADGKAVGIMPEGTRGEKHELAELKEFKRGAAQVAINARVPIVPVGIIGTEAYVPLIDKQSLGRTLEELRETKKNKGEPPLEMAIGEPITLHLEWEVERGTGNYSEKLTVLTDTVEKRIKGLVELLESS
jgi:1-acyl-sn-glycerol-3-phosphate acyltransferase